MNKWFLTLSFKTGHFSFHWTACVVEWHSFLVCWSCECIISVLREDQFLSIIAFLFLIIIFIIIIIIVYVFSAYRGDKAPRSSVICCCPGISSLMVYIYNFAWKMGFTRNITNSSVFPESHSSLPPWIWPRDGVGVKVRVSGARAQGPWWPRISFKIITRVSSSQRFRNGDAGGVTMLVIGALSLTLPSPGVLSVWALMGMLCCLMIFPEIGEYL